MFDFEDTSNDLWHVPIKIRVVHVTLFEQVQQLYDSFVPLHHFVRENKVPLFGSLCLFRVTVFGLVAESVAEATFALTKKPAISSLVTSHVTLAAAVSIRETLVTMVGVCETTCEGRFLLVVGCELMNSFLFYGFPCSS